MSAEHSELFKDLEVERRARDKEDRQDLRELELSYSNVMKTDAGRAVLIDIVFTRCGAFSAGRNDEFLQGMKHVGLTLLDFMASADATATVQIIDEGYIDGYRRVD